MTDAPVPHDAPENADPDETDGASTPDPPDANGVNDTERRYGADENPS